MEWVTPVTSPGRPERTRPNWGWIAPTFLVGASVVVVTIATAGSRTQAGLVQSFLINVGTAVLLLGVLGFVEPRLRRAYIEATDRRIEASAQEVEERLTSRVAEVEEEVKSARALFEEYMAAEDAAVAAAAEHPDFYSVATALAAANGGHALWRSGVAVPATVGIPSILIQFQYLTPTQSRAKDQLRVAAIVTDTAHWMRDIDIVWGVADTSEQVGAAMMLALRGAGVKDVEQKVDWAGTLERLTAALVLSMESTRAAGHLDGALIERGPGDWALTSKGIEHLQHGVIVSAESFPLDVANSFMKQSDPDYREPWKDIDKPSWAQNDEWNYIITRARKVLPGSHLPVLFTPPYVPSDTPPRKPGPGAGGFDFAG